MNDPTLETTVLDELPEPPEETTTPEPKEGAPEEPAKQDDLRAAMTELAGTVKRIAEPPAAAPAAPSPEEVAEFWAVYDPESTDKEFFRKWFRLNPDATEEEIFTVKELFAGVQKGLMKQSVTAARNYIQFARQEIDRDYGPLKEYVEERKREETRGRFYDPYPGLGDTKYQKIIDATARALDGQSFDNESAYFKALAEGAAGSIRDIVPEFDLGKPTTTKTPGKTPKLPRTSAGGGGGAGKGSHAELNPTGSKNDIDTLEDET